MPSHPNNSSHPPKPDGLQLRISPPSAEDTSAIMNSDDNDDLLGHGGNVLQILFDPRLQANRRRKSSLIHMDATRAPSSSCFVHALLETQRKSVASSPASAPVSNGILEGALAQTAKEIPVVQERMDDCGSFAAMTKSQLSDMVLGVRELSKHLASMSIQMHVRSILIVTKAYDKSMISYTAILTRWLLGKGYIVYVESTLEDDTGFDSHGIVEKAKNKEQAKTHLRYWTPELCANRPHVIDFVVTLGGDGTVLYASWLFQRVAPPTLSFSLGSLGFLTKFDFDHHEHTLMKAFNEGVTIGLRLRFEGTVMRSLPSSSSSRDLCDEILTPEGPDSPPTHQRGESFIILNEIVVGRGPNPTLSTTELYGDNMFLTSIAADGVCIATPTGSTAYSLAAGGSLVHPELPGMLVSVICAHSLTFRPLILPDSMVLRIGVPYTARTSSWVSFDGRSRTELKQGDYVSIIASRFPFPLIQCKRDNMDWFDSLRRTMNWGARAQQRPFDHKI